MKMTIKLLIMIVIGFVAGSVMGVSAENQATANEPTYAELEKTYSQMKQEMTEHMTLMHKQMDEIKATKDPDKRQQLMREHEWAMYESMEIMEQMGDSGTRMLNEEDETAYQSVLEERLGYMQKMMVQMMRHLAAQNAYVK